MDCIICMEPVTNIECIRCSIGCLKPIGHKICTDVWFKYHEICPLCRTKQNDDDEEDQIVSNTHINYQQHNMILIDAQEFWRQKEIENYKILTLFMTNVIVLSYLMIKTTNQ